MMEYVRVCGLAHGELAWLFLEADTGTLNLDHNNRAMATTITQTKSAPKSWHCPPFGQKSGSVKT